MTLAENLQLYRELADPALDFDEAVRRLEAAGAPHGIARQTVLELRGVIGGDDRPPEDDERARAFFAAMNEKRRALSVCGLTR